jgi:hypothetical protein
MVKFAKKAYKRYDSTAKKQVDAEPAKCENYYVKVLSQLEEGKVYSGKFLFKEDSYMDMVITGLDAFGQVIPDQNIAMLNAGFFSIQEIAEPVKIDPAKFKVPAQKAWGSYGSKGQSEYERLQDRWKFVKEQIAIAEPNYTIEGLHSFNTAVLKLCNPNGDLIYSTWKNCLCLMGVSIT